MELSDLDFRNTYFMDLLLKTFQNNRHGNSGNRYEPEFRQFCLYYYLISGRLSYETLRNNIKCLPSISTLLNNMDVIWERYRDGKLQLI